MVDDGASHGNQSPWKRKWWNYRFWDIYNSYMRQRVTVYAHLKYTSTYCVWLRNPAPVDSDLPHYLQVFYHSGAGFLTPTVFKPLIRQRAPPLHITMPVIQPFQSHQAIHTRFFASLPHITGNVQWMYAFTKFHVVTMIAFHTHAFLNVPLFWRI